MAFGSEFFSGSITSEVDPQKRLMDNMLRGAQLRETNARAEASSLDNVLKREEVTEGKDLRKKERTVKGQQADRQIANKDLLDDTFKAGVQNELSKALLETSDQDLERHSRSLWGIRKATTDKDGQQALDYLWKSDPDTAKELELPRKYDARIKYTIDTYVDMADNDKAMRQKRIEAGIMQDNTLEQMRVKQGYDRSNMRLGDSLDYATRRSLLGQENINQQSRDQWMIDQGFTPSGSAVGSGSFDTGALINSNVGQLSARQKVAYEESTITRMADRVTATLNSKELWEGVPESAIKAIAGDEGRIYKNAIGSDASDYYMNQEKVAMAQATAAGQLYIPGDEGAATAKFVEANRDRLAKSVEYGKYLTPEEYANILDKTVWNSLPEADRKKRAAHIINLQRGTY